jgi:hypothetical protein
LARSLRRARAPLTGESAIARISREDVASYLAERRGARPGEIAKALGVASGTVSAHLLRGKGTYFVSSGGDWFGRGDPKRGFNERRHGRVASAAAGAQGLGFARLRRR